MSTPRLQMLHQDTVPPGGFRYRHPTTGFLLTAPTWPDLVAVVKKHYTANNLPFPVTWIEDIETQICETAPPGTCHYGDQTPVAAGFPALNFSTVMQFTATMADWLASSGMTRVPQAQADSRAQVCGRCQFNQPINGCASCSLAKLHQVVNRIVGGATLNGANHLHACYLCGCSVKAKVWLPIDVLRRHMTDREIDRLPDHCWIKKETV